jgi:hypothetical protein
LAQYFFVGDVSAATEVVAGNCFAKLTALGMALTSFPMLALAFVLFVIEFCHSGQPRCGGSASNKYIAISGKNRTEFLGFRERFWGISGGSLGWKLGWQVSKETRQLNQGEVGPRDDTGREASGGAMGIVGKAGKFGWVVKPIPILSGAARCYGAR